MFEEKAQTVYYRVTANRVEPIQGNVIGESRWTMRE
jgi:hypothetical protein